MKTKQNKKIVVRAEGPVISIMWAVTHGISRNDITTGTLLLSSVAYLNVTRYFPLSLHVGKCLTEVIRRSPVPVVTTV